MIQPNQENKTYGIKSHLGFLRQHVTFHFPESPDFEKNQPKKCIYTHINFHVCPGNCQNKRSSLYFHLRGHVKKWKPYRWTKYHRDTRDFWLKRHGEMGKFHSPMNKRFSVFFRCPRYFCTVQAWFHGVWTRGGHQKNMPNPKSLMK